MKTSRRVLSHLFVVLLSLTVAGSLAVVAGDGPTYRVTVTNLTQGQVFSPPLVVAHDAGVALFEEGAPASEGLAALAEDGQTQPLSEALSGMPGIHGIATADGPIPPGASRSVEVPATGGRALVSALGMLVQTNDSFFFGRVAGLPDAAVLVPGAGSAVPLSSSALANAWDAGSERNTESCEHIPGPPCGNPGVRVTEGAEGFVHVSAGMHGVGDLSASVYDWRNPVARIDVERID
jgi:hypothetical protein